MISQKNLHRLGNIFSLYPTEAAYLFGSQLKGKVGELSDVDIAVYFSPSRFNSLSLDIFLNLIGDLKRALGKQGIDLAVLNNASPTLKHEAVLGGQRIYAKDEKEALEFEKRILQEHEDTAFLRQTYYRYMQERIKNGRFGEL